MHGTRPEVDSPQPPAPAQKLSGGPAQKTRSERESDALRENLRRRKQQLRARQARQQDGAEA